MSHDKILRLNDGALLCNMKHIIILYFVEFEVSQEEMSCGYERGCMNHIYVAFYTSHENVQDIYLSPNYILLHVWLADTIISGLL
jgi:hypothetical protein